MFEVLRCVMIFDILVRLRMCGMNSSGENVDGKMVVCNLFNIIFMIGKLIYVFCLILDVGVL